MSETARIRTDWLRHVAEDQLEGLTAKERERLVSDLLGQHLVLNLDRPQVRLEGFTLGAEHEVDCGTTATAMPNDSCPRLIEGILRRYTEVGDKAAYLFATSSAARVVAQRLEREAVLLDEYGTEVENLFSKPLCSPETVRSLTTCPDGSRKLFDLLYVHSPMPGIVDKRSLLYPGNADVPSGREDWAQLEFDSYLTKMEALLALWSEVVAPEGVLCIQVGWGRWDGQAQMPWPALHECAYRAGWRREHWCRLRIEPRRGPVNDPALTSGMLLAYTKQGGRRC